MDLLEELVRFYYAYDKFQTNYLQPEEALKYHGAILSKGRVCHVGGEEGELLGYCESWRLTYEQFGRILCGEPFFVESEDIEHGPLAYVANVTVHPSARRGRVIKELTSQFFEKNKDAEYFVGEAKRKKTQPVKVFKMQEAYKKWCGNS
jgi:hypothetical protein